MLTKTPPLGFLDFTLVGVLNNLQLSKSVIMSNFCVWIGSIDENIDLNLVQIFLRAHLGVENIIARAFITTSGTGIFRSENKLLTCSSTFSVLFFALDILFGLRLPLTLCLVVLTTGLNLL